MRYTLKFAAIRQFLRLILKYRDIILLLTNLIIWDMIFHKYKVAICLTLTQQELLSQLIHLHSISSTKSAITLSPQIVISKIYVCFNFAQSWWKCCPSVKQLGLWWDTELLSVSSGSKLFAYGTVVMLGGLKVNVQKNLQFTFKTDPVFWNHL